MAKKAKYVHVGITTHQLPDLERSVSRGILNSTEPLWMAAFAVYNMNTKLRLSMEFDSSYKTVFDYIKSKLS